MCLLLAPRESSLGFGGYLWQAPSDPVSLNTQNLHVSQEGLFTILNPFILWVNVSARFHFHPDRVYLWHIVFGSVRESYLVKVAQLAAGVHRLPMLVVRPGAGNHLSLVRRAGRVLIE